MGRYPLSADDLLAVVDRTIAMAEERGGPATHNPWALLTCFRDAVKALQAAEEETKQPKLRTPFEREAVYPALREAPISVRTAAAQTIADDRADIIIQAKKLRQWPTTVKRGVDGCGTEWTTEPAVLLCDLVALIHGEKIRKVQG